MVPSVGVCKPLVESTVRFLQKSDGVNVLVGVHECGALGYGEGSSSPPSADDDRIVVPQARELLRLLLRVQCRTLIAPRSVDQSISPAVGGSVHLHRRDCGLITQSAQGRDGSCPALRPEKVKGEEVETGVSTQTMCWSVRSRESLAKRDLASTLATSVYVR